MEGSDIRKPKSRSSKSSKSVNIQTPLNLESAKIMSESDISMQDLELLANKKKVIKKLSNISIEAPKSSSSDVIKKNSSPRKKKERSVSSSESSESILEKRNRRATRENKDDAIRREKSEFLRKIGILNSKGNRSSLRFDMNNTLEDIRNEYECIRTNMENERMVKFCKQMLLMGVQGIEMSNTYFDPLGVDLDGWSESMAYSMENQEYDEVVAELYEKYKGKGSMSPELKLTFMIIGSATMFAITKKVTQSTTGSQDNMLSSLIGSMMGKKQSSPQNQPQTPTQMPQQTPQQMTPELMQQLMQQQQQQQQMQQQMQQQYQQQQQMQKQMDHQQQQQQQYVHPGQYMGKREPSETSDDPPSKIKGPEGSFDSPDSVILQDIMKTMAANKAKQKNQVDIVTLDLSSEPEVKAVTMKNKKGRVIKKVIKGK
jgi:hypothetical protein